MSWNYTYISCRTFNPKQAGGGRNRPQAGSPFSCAETLSSKELKLCEFYDIFIRFHFEYKLVPWAINCCHGSTIVEKCLAKIDRKLYFFPKSFFNFNLGFLLQLGY